MGAGRWHGGQPQRRELVSPTFTIPAITGTLTFILTVIDPFGLSDIDNTTVTVALPALTTSKSAPIEVMAGDLITLYTGNH
jgi:hypothetical protein